MIHNKNMAGHLAALLTIVIWGTTFVSTKVLLRTFTPVEILVIRFVLGYAALWCVCPRTMKLRNKKQELYFAAAGLCGITMYYLLENIALTYTLAANVGVIISIAPFFTAILSCLFLKEKRPGLRFLLGFLAAMAGICMLSFGGDKGLSLNPKGDLLAIGAAAVWAAYSILTRKISAFGYNTILVTRRTFFYGLLFMIPAAVLMDGTGTFVRNMAHIVELKNLLNLLFLGLGASALCFVTWNVAVKELGALKTSVYIYLVPVITTAASILVLHEHITPVAAVGMVLTLAGLFLSQEKQTSKLNKEGAGEKWKCKMKNV